MMQCYFAAGSIAVVYTCCYFALSVEIYNVQNESLYTSHMHNACLLTIDEQTAFDAKIYDPTFTVTFVTHGTLNYISYLVSLRKQFVGPISISVNVPKFNSLSEVYYMLHIVWLCMQKPKSSLSITMYYTAHKGICHYPLDQSHKKPSFYFNKRLRNCSRQIEEASYLLSLLSKYPDDTYYNRNFGRNIAKLNVRTIHQLAADLEFIPCFNFQKKISNYLLHNNKKYINSRNVYLVPTFEVKQGMPIPRRKKVLQELLLKGIVFRFKFFSKCTGCFGIPKLATWIQLNFSVANIFLITKYVPINWEPIFVADSSVPIYNEAFGGVGYDKVQQLYEMCLSNYSFYILDDVFVTHISDDVHEVYGDSATYINIAKNFAAFHELKKDLLATYSKRVQTDYCNNWQPLNEK